MAFQPSMIQLRQITRALIVKEPYAGWIVDGKKGWEFRSRRTNIRERIGIIQAGTKTIIGEVDLVDCFAEIINRHGDFIWKLENAIRYEKPKSYKHPRGAQVWVNLNRK